MARSGTVRRDRLESASESHSNTATGIATRQAIKTAADKLNPGDIILIELQRSRPQGRAYFLASKNCTNASICWSVRLAVIALVINPAVAHLFDGNFWKMYIRGPLIIRSRSYASGELKATEKGKTPQ